MIKKVGERIRTIREAKNLTQANMAEELGMKNSSGYAKIERGDINTPLNRLFQIADVLEVSITEFFIDQKVHIQDNQATYGFATKEEVQEVKTTILKEFEKLREELRTEFKKSPQGKNTKRKK